MSLARGAAAPARAWLRLGARGTAAFLWTSGLFALYLLVRTLERFGGQLLRPVSALAPWIVMGWARGALRLLGLRVRVGGAPMRRAGAVVANHSSWLDIVVLQSVMRLSFVSKSEVAAWPVIGFIGRSIGTMFVERRSSAAARQAEALRGRLASGDRLGIFPEGTSSNGARVLPFKSALFASFLDAGMPEDVRVQPVSIRYRPAAGLPATFYGWWGDMDFGPHLAQMLARSVAGEVDVLFHAPLAAADYPDRKSLAARAEQDVRAGFEALGPITPAP